MAGAPSLLRRARDPHRGAARRRAARVAHRPGARDDGPHRVRARRRRPALRVVRRSRAGRRAGARRRRRAARTRCRRDRGADQPAFPRERSHRPVPLLRRARRRGRVPPRPRLRPHRRRWRLDRGADDRSCRSLRGRARGRGTVAATRALSGDLWRAGAQAVAALPGDGDRTSGSARGVAARTPAGHQGPRRRLQRFRPLPGAGRELRTPARGGPGDSGSPSTTCCSPSC